jgi:Pyruvate/2-oxoacid:ferredoxin oxidoreductase gamma subunit
VSPEDRAAMVAVAIGDTYLELAQEGCTPPDIGAGLAAMLGALLASCACCDEHLAAARASMLAVIDHNVAVNRAGWQVVKDEADFPPVEGHA